MAIDLQVLEAQELADGSQRVTFTYAPVAGAAFGAAETLHHDLEGALRAFRYLAQKAAATYPTDDPRGAKAQASIAKHLETLEMLKRDIIEPLFPMSPVFPNEDDAP